MQNATLIQSIRNVSKEATRPSIFGDISKASLEKEATPLDIIREKNSLTLDEMIEAISYWFFHQFGDQDLAKAYERFQRWAGHIYYDDYFYHQHVAYFADRFCFEDINNAGIVPYEAFIESQSFLDLCTPVAQEQFLELKNRSHSLFQVTKKNKSGLTVKDLFTQKKHLIPLEIPIHGFEKGSIIQGFIFAHKEKMALSKGSFVHPPRIDKEVRLQIKRITKEQEHPLALLSRLARQHLIYRKHKPKDILKVYQSDPYLIV